MIKAQDAISAARSLIGTPYSEIDCIEAQALYTALMTDKLIEGCKYAGKTDSLLSSGCTQRSSFTGSWTRA